LKAIRAHWSFDLLGGCFGIAIALGLVRFDFGIIGNLMADAQWIDVEDIGALAAINMAGYLTGCIQQATVKSRETSIRYVWFAMITIIASIILEGQSTSFTSQSILRLLCGWGAAHVVSGLPTLALERVPERWRRKATGLIMSGGGIGSLLGAVCIGFFAPESAPSALNVLTALTVVLSLPTLALLRRRKQLPKPVIEQLTDSAKKTTSYFSKRKLNQLILIIILGFALMQVGQVPVVLYEPLIAINRIGLTPMMASNINSLFGIGLIIGGLIPSVVPSKLTTSLFLAVIAAVGLAGMILFGISNHLVVLSISIFLIGVWDMMTGTLTLDRLGQLCNEEAQRRAWSTATTIGAMGFIAFSSTTSQLSKHNINLILAMGITAVSAQLILEIVQHRLSAKQQSSG